MGPSRVSREERGRRVPGTVKIVKEGWCEVASRGLVAWYYVLGRNADQGSLANLEQCGCKASEHRHVSTARAAIHADQEAMIGWVGKLQAGAVRTRAQSRASSC